MTDRDEHSRDPLPIDTTEPMATQSRHALMVAYQELGLLTYRWPVDMRQPAQVEQLHEELGPHADLPTTDGVFYLVYVDNTEGRRVPVLIPEGEVRAFVLALAVNRSVDAARSVQYVHGTLPA